MSRYSESTATRPVLGAAAILLTLVILPTSVTGSGVALPRIGRDTGAALDLLQWVVHAYNLTFACFMLACGAMADLLGRRRVFAAGAALFVAASLVSAIAPGVLLLDAARALAGIGAAALLTSGSSILATTFDGPARVRVFAAVGIATGSGLALGAMAAGTVVDLLGWRWFFGAHAVLMAIVLVAVPFLGESRRADGAAVDLPGTLTFVGALLLLMLGLVEGPQWGWASGSVLGMFAGSGVLAICFAVIERRRAQPMLDLALLRNRRFVALSLIPVVVSFAYVILLPLLPNYLMVAKDLTSRAAGGVLLLMSAPILVAPALAGALLRRGMTNRAVFTISLVCLTVGIGWLAIVLRPGGGIGSLIAPLVVLGVGLGLNFGSVDAAVLTVVGSDETGTAAGFLNTLRLGSEAVVIAAAGSALVNLTQHGYQRGLHAFPAYQPGAGPLANQVNAGDLDSPLAAVGPEIRPDFGVFIVDGFTQAWQIVLGACAVICALLSVVIYVLLAERGAPVPVVAEVAESRV
ncbi:MFS transporter [Nocardia arthritidis]|uniref:MFS transporter n=1 Tax=Nocardia arthritidis TaxID=228602 RepID=A0A6G9Y7P5_9NOCA|nr:MFS transporter [Nocardia arthritidis]QIS09242.1 MFS transporter [Nocardia arthritidis]